MAITSGFMDFRDLAWLERDGFCHLKLHGVSVFPGKPEQRRKNLPLELAVALPLNAFDLFDSLAAPRLAGLSQPPFSEEDVPAILPWEIMGEDGKLLGKSEFCQAVGESWHHVELYDLFSGIWCRAREEIKTATKISFVGLSMGAFLEPEFKFLFQSRSGAAEIVVVNPDNDKYRSNPDPLYARSPRGRTHAMLQRHASPDFHCLASSVESGEGPLMDQFKDAQNPYEPNITAYNTFAEFIEKELLAPVL